MLAIDVGNTFIKAAVIDEGGVSEISYLSTEECIRKNRYFSMMPLAESGGKGIVVASVRKQALEIIKEEAMALFGKTPFIVDINTETGIRNLYLSPDTLGIDRLVTAAAAWHLYRKKGRPVITVDLGTATTVDLISASGEFAGGIIAPGLQSALLGLLENAPELPKVAVEKAERLIGRTTSECMSSGAVASQAAMIRGLTEMIDTQAVVVVTGGMVPMISNWLKESYIIDDNLMFKGLKIIYDRNSNCPKNTI
jgi:type III pantothenate kinase